MQTLGDDADGLVPLGPHGGMAWQDAVGLPDEVLPAAVAVLEAASAAVPVDAATWELGVRWCGEAEGRAANNQFRGKDSATNVLSFEGEEAGDGEAYVGDILICWPVIVREAEEQGKATLAHAQHMLVHGWLHLRGFDHLTPAEAEAMEAQEIHILAALGLSNPYEDTDPC